MDLTLHNSTEKVSVSDAAFAVDFNEALIHQLVVSYMATGRAGTKATKSRSDVSGGGAKPWNQKGTGRARAGTIRSPLWRSGGMTFAATPRDYSKKVNKKMYRSGMRSILSELVRQDRLIVVDTIGVTAPKTKDMIAKLADFGVSKGLLLVDEMSEAVALSARNIPNIEVLDVTKVNPVSLVNNDKVVIEQAALKKLEERLS